MISKELLKKASSFGWRKSLAIVSANVKLYGWLATVKKVIKRVGVTGNLYRTFIQRLERLEINAVQESRLLFGKPRILIVGALDLPQCRKYRVLQKVEFFESMGWGCSYAHFLDESRVISDLQISTALIFYRVPAIPQIDDYLREAKRLGVKTFYDIDDPIFSEDVYGQNDNLKHLDADERTHLLASAVRYREAMTKVDALILSTSYLRDLASNDFNTPVFLWRNLADSATLSMVESCRKNRKSKVSTTVVIGYASGSRAHDEDFRVVSDALSKVLNDNSNVILRLIGYVVIPPELSAYTDRIESTPFSSYLQYLEALNGIDLNVVPLVNNRFNECKSAIRYLEASLCEVPTIASSVGQFREIIVDGKDGCLAATTQDWVSKLTMLVDNREQRLTMGVESRRKVIREHSIAAEGAVDQDVVDQFVVSNE